METMLNPRVEALVDDTKSLLRSLLETLEGWEDRPDETGRIGEAIEGLSGLFLLVIAGEFNAGKSRLTNTLLGGRFLEEGVTPTTQTVQVLGYGPETTTMVLDGYVERRMPVELLREMRLVDTPGTNAIVREHEALTRDFVPKADLVIFVTSADRPFTESERAFLSSIRDWGKEIVFVVNKIDLMETEADLSQVLGFVRGAATALLEAQPTLFALSARDAFRALEQDDSEGLERSGWTAFESWLLATLTSDERLRLKLESPIGVAEAVMKTAGTDIEARLGLLAGDRAALDRVEEDVQAFEARLRDALVPRFDRIDNQILELRARGEVFLDEQFRLLNLRSLINGEELRSRFEREVVADAPERIAKEIDALIDVVVDEEFTQWRTLRTQLEASSNQAVREAVARGADEGFASRRGALLDSIGQEAEEVIQGFDARAVSARMVADVQNTLTSAGLAEAGALGLGLLVHAVHASTVALLDFTGILATGALAVFGLAILPYRRRQATEALRERVAGLRSELHDTVSQALDREVESSVTRMDEALEPYARFVRDETASLETLQSALSEGRRQTAELKGRIGQALSAGTGSAS